MNQTAESARISSTPQCTATELEGYVDLGMGRQARKLARQILSKKRILPEEFYETIHSIGIFSDFGKWKTEIESAYQRQSRRFQKCCRAAMLSFYFSLGDEDKASQYLSTERPPDPADAFFTMNVLLELGRLEEAKVLAAKMGRLINRAQEPAGRAFLIEGVARYFARLGKWDTAAEVWSWAPLEQAFRADAIVGLVHLHLARALNQSDQGLKALKEIGQNVDLGCEIIIPGNDEGITRDLEKELLKLKHELEKLLPEKRRTQPGLESTQLGK